MDAKELNSSPHLPADAHFKLLTTFKLLNGLLYCPPDLIVFNAFPNTRVSQLVVPFPKTAAYLNSFFVSTTIDCGTVYHEIMCIMTVGQFEHCSKYFLVHLSYCI